MAPCSKHSLLGVECLAGERSLFQVCMCDLVKIAVAVQMGVSDFTALWPAFCAHWQQPPTSQAGALASSHWEAWETV